MKKFLAIILTLLVFCGCTPKPHNLTEGLIPKNSQNIEQTEDFPHAFVGYSLKMLNESLKKDENENVLISPLSQMLALGMLSNGAANNTKAQMDSLFACAQLNEQLSSYVLGLPDEEKTNINIANSIWIKNTDDIQVKNSFLQAGVDYYNAEVFKADFNNTTVKQINNWVKENTDNMIDNVLDDIPVEAIMYLINALSFDGEWSKIYERSQIKKDFFNAIDGQKQTVDFMRSNESRYLEDENACGFMKSYKYDKYRFVALLPNEDMNIYEYVASLKASALLNMLKEPISVSVNANMPKFEYDYSIELNDPLKNMGMVDAFDIYNADFSNMATSDSGNIFISKVLHKTHIRVDEKGTKAGAVTIIEAKNASAPMDIKTVTLNRPFLYMIIDTENSLPMFMGVVTNIK